MMIAFFFVVTLGHAYCALMVIALTFISYKEVISLKRKDEKDEKNVFSWMDKYYFGIFCFATFPQYLLNNKSLNDTT